MSAARPNIGDAAVVRAAAEAFAPRIMGWVQAGGGDEDVTKDEIVGDLVKFGCGYVDGYELAKRFERGGYMPDADLVEILDCFGFAKRDAERTAVKNWVIAEAIRPEFAPGQIVDVSGHCGGTGPVVQVNTDEAYYVVKLPDGGGRHPSGYIGTVVDFERATLSTVQVPA